MIYTVDIANENRVTGPIAPADSDYSLGNLAVVKEAAIQCRTRDLELLIGIIIIVVTEIY